MDSLEAMVLMRSAWHRRIPRALIEEDPKMLLRLIKIAAVKDGVVQTALQKELEIQQSKMSKLSLKLEREGWIKVRRGSDRRQRLLTASPRAQAAIASLLSDLNDILSRAAKPAAKRKPLDTGRYVYGTLLNPLSPRAGRAARKLSSNSQRPASSG